MYIIRPLPFLKCIATSGLWLEIREFELSKLGILLAQKHEKCKFNPDLWGRG